MLKNLKLEQAGLSICGNFVRAAAHADDLRTIAASKCSLQEQVDIINKFTSSNHLKLNSSKTEIIKISYRRPPEDSISLASTKFNIIYIIFFIYNNSVIIWTRLHINSKNANT